MKHPGVLEAFIGGAWTAVTSEVLDGHEITIKRGLTEQGELRPCSVSWTFHDPTGKWRTSNPTSPLYGLAGRNTPIRVTLDGSTRAYAEATSWTPETTLGGPGKVHLLAEGQQKRMGKWEEELRSPLYRQLVASPTSAYWPLEDGSDATSATSAVTSGRPATVTDVNFGDDDSPGGASASAVLNTAGVSRIAGTVPTWPIAQDGYQCVFFFRLESAVVGGIGKPLFDVRAAGAVARWFLEINDLSFTLYGYDSSGTLLTGSGPRLVNYPSTQWLGVRLRCVEAGGTVNWTLSWWPPSGDSFEQASGSYAGTADRVTAVNVYAPTASTHVTHLWVGDDSVSITSAGFREVSGGYVGEAAGDRWWRLMQESGFAGAFTGVQGDTEPMGAQPAATLIELVKEMLRTDDALSYDSRNALRQVFRTRKSLYNQAAALALTWPGDIAQPFTEKVDDDGVYNRVSVSQRNGGEAVAVRASGPLSVQPPPAGVSEVRKDVPVNVASEAVLPVLAGWWLARGTAHGLSARYPQVTIDLDARPDLIAAVNAVDIGDRITIAGYNPDSIGLLVIGIEEKARTWRRLVTFTCVPDTVFNPALYDATVKRYDSRATTLQTGVNATATAWTVTYPTPSDAWTTKPASLPFDLLVAGERVRVTFVGARTGSGPYTQPMTVQRSINGVAKPQTAGTEIHVADVARYAR